MSELMNRQSGRKDVRWQLLTTVSALALIGNVYGAQGAKADNDTDRPVLWIELGGQLEQQTSQGDVYSPSFVANNPDSPVYKPVSPLRFEKPPLFSNGAEGKMTFEPENSDWVFSASVRYGRSNGAKNFDKDHLVTHVGHITSRTRVGTKIITYPSGGTGTRAILGNVKGTRLQSITQFADAQVAQKQSHAIVDFSAGKEVGLGMFGRDSVSDIYVGVRFAQFVSGVSGAINARPDAKFIKFYEASFHARFPSYAFQQYAKAFHSYAATFQSRRSFHGVGPALSWNASLAILGEPQIGILNLDWGSNGALLFGKQRSSGSHQSSANYVVHYVPSLSPTHHTNVDSFDRSRTIIVPNIGGFAGLSFSFTNAKVSLGYRGDFFFGAMDTGNDTRKTKTVGFYGPFATIGIGFGE